MAEDTVTKPVQPGEHAVTLQVKNQDLIDIIVTMIEGGYSSWCHQIEMSRCVTATANQGEVWNEYISRNVVEGGELVFKVDYDENGRLTDYVLTLPKLLDGITRALAEGRPALPEAQGFDAIAADVVIQLALFGEIVFG